MIYSVHYADMVHGIDLEITSYCIGVLVGLFECRVSRNQIIFRKGLNDMRRFILCGLIIINIIVSILLMNPSLAERNYDWIRNHIHVEYKDHEDWKELELALHYSHEHGIMADGILMFSSLSEFLQHEYSAPEVDLSNEPVYRVSYDSYVDNYRSSTIFYALTDGGLKKLVDSNGDPVLEKDLDPGKYLMTISVYGQHNGEGYSGASFIWVTITD